MTSNDDLKDLLYQAIGSVGYNIVDEVTDKFLGTQLERKANGRLCMHQEQYALKLIAKYDISESAPTPLSSGYTFENYIENGMSKAIPIVQFQKILGDMMCKNIFHS